MTTFKKALRGFSAVILSYVVSAVALAVPVNGVYVFGDSLSDNGNLFAATGNPPAPYFEGRFSNGLLYSELLSASLGAGTLMPASVGGTNYAWAGARTGTDVPLGGGAAIPSVNSQVSGFVANQGGVVDASALYVVFGGGNDVADVIDAGLTGAAATPFILAAVNSVLSSVDVLIASNAGSVLVPNLPDLGLTPRFQAEAVVATDLSMQFNDALLVGLLDRQTEVTPFDTFAFMRDAAGSFTEQAAPCFNGVTVCLNPDDYVFFDDFHPTAQFHRVFADELVSTLTASVPGGGGSGAGGSAEVPEPGTIALFAIGLVGFAASRRKNAVFSR